MAMLLLSLAVLNMPQVMVLCIGHDGHVALELAAHDHCADGSHVHEGGPAGLEAGDHSHVGHEHCLPCVDIPIPVGVGDGRIASQKPRLNPVYFAAFQSAAHVSDVFDIAAWMPSGAPPSFCISLRCTILQV